MHACCDALAAIEVAVMHPAYHQLLIGASQTSLYHLMGAQHLHSRVVTADAPYCPICPHAPRRNMPRPVCAQNVDIAIIKATTSKFHVVPKEKHVRSGPSPSLFLHAVHEWCHVAPSFTCSSLILNCLFHGVSHSDDVSGHCCSPEDGRWLQRPRALRAQDHHQARRSPPRLEGLAGATSIRLLAVCDAPLQVIPQLLKG